MAKERQAADWIEIDPATLSTGQQGAYAEYKRLYATMKAARETFQNAMQTGVAEGQRMIFGYNFGKLSVAIVAAEEVKAGRKAVSLSDYLAAQAVEGRQV